MAKYVDVSAYDEKFRKAKVDGPVTLPDGEYAAVICKAEFDHVGKQRPEPAFKWKFEIIDGDFAGNAVEKVSLLRDNLIHWLKKDLGVCGLPYDTLSKVQQYQGDLLGIEVQIKLETKEVNGTNRQNVYIQQRMISKSEKPASIPKEDDIPF